MPDLKIVVITVNYKRAEDTVACVASLQRSTVPVLVVVVDNSPNDTELEKALASYSDVHLIRAPENLGFGRGNNLGIKWVLKNTACEFVFFLNNDATVEPTSIEKLRNVMDSRSDIGLATGRIVTTDNESLLWYGGGEINWRRGGGSVPGFMGSASCRLALEAREVTFASGCAMLIRRNVIEQVGGFDPLFFMYEEDIDLSIRIRKAGYKLYYHPQAVFCHKVQGSQRANTVARVGRWTPTNPNFDFHVYHMVRNSIINMRKHAAPRDWLTCIIIYPLFLFLKSLQAVRIRGIDALKPVFKGVREGISVPLGDNDRCYTAIKGNKA